MLWASQGSKARYRRSVGKGRVKPALLHGLAMADVSLPTAATAEPQLPATCNQCMPSGQPHMSHPQPGPLCSALACVHANHSLSLACPTMELPQPITTAVSCEPTPLSTSCRAARRGPRWISRVIDCEWHTHTRECHMATHCSAVTTLAPSVTPSPTRHSANSLCLVWAAH